MMEKIIHYNNLFDCYKNLLKIDEQDIFLEYYEEDLSMQEIADNVGISKSAVGKKIKIIENKLDEFENNLKIYEKNNLLSDLLEINNIEEIKEKISIIIN